MPKQKTIKERKIKGWMYEYSATYKPTISLTKPTKYATKTNKEIGVRTYEVEITIKKEIK